LLGVSTFILPCGFTQSMQIYSLSTGSFLTGALTMFTFALGTLPVLGMISFASMKFSKTLQSGLFFKVAGFLVLFFAIFNLYSSILGLGIIG
jgi:sulfite exporter TauE/SafE